MYLELPGLLRLHDWVICTQNRNGVIMACYGTGLSITLKGYLDSSLTRFIEISSFESWIPWIEKMFEMLSRSVVFQKTW